ncbi:unnamed protein product [Parnassius apollo]|uniref:(apollo) hypothetical protein n=1 Tax=Parnassius apollo TaxID=110799 RepID=A0A8S3XBX7_PARAO|nr:unnamed protein product [Parnassius apollo]
MIELEMQIEQLKQTIQAANTEVDNLILQNNDLQRELENCQMVIKSLRAIQTLGPEKIRETWTNELKLGVTTIEGFKLVSYYNRMLFEHGGTAIFVRHSLEYKVRHDIVKLSIEMNCELAAIEVKSSKLVIICVYRPDYDYLIFEDIMTKVIEKIGRENKRIVIAGDFNLNLLKPNNKVCKFLKLLSELKCKFVLNEPTRTKGKSSTCIDNFILNDDDDFQYHRGKVLDVKLSDHNVIELKYKLNSKYPKPKEKTEVRSRIISQENIKYFHYLFCKDFECVRKDVNLKLDANEKMNILKTI